MRTEELVREALRHKAPSIYKQLMENGKLSEFLKERADEIREAVATLGREIAVKHGYNEAMKTDPMKAVGIHNMADALAREIVYAEMLEFPQDETSPQSLDETTGSDQTT